MSEELKNICENCNFDNAFKELLELVEIHYNLKVKEEIQDGEEHFTMVQWLLENTKIDELNCLSEKEKFLYGLGILSLELMNC